MHLCHASTISLTSADFTQPLHEGGGGWCVCVCVCTAVELKYCSGKSYAHTKFDDHTLHGTSINATQVG
jgi:hypothetical protein